MSTTPVILRLATMADAETVAQFSRSCFYETFAPVNTTANMEKFMNSQFTVSRLAEEVDTPGNTFVLAFCRHTLAGFARLLDNHKIFPGREAIELSRIYVSQAFTGKGVGHALMEDCLRLCRGMKKDLLWLGVWEHNTRAIQFYHQWGFRQYGTHLFLLGDDLQTDWLMQKEII